MVHKKSEYRLQFHSLSEDLRKQIWQDNIRFREFRRSVNQAHHYWSYQITDEPCVCDDTTEQNADRQDDMSAPAVLDSLEKSNDFQGYAQESCLTKRPKSGCQRQVRLKEPEIEENFAHEVAVQTPEWIPEEKVNSKTASPELHHLMQNLSTSSPEINNTRKEQNEERELDSASPIRTTLPAPTARQQSVSPDDIKEYQPRPERPFSACSPDAYRKRNIPTRMSSPTRTSRKYYFEERRSPFASYGWKETHRNIGEKKTYNVNAPESEVHTPALRAQRRRREDIERYLKKEADLRKRVQYNKSPVNLGSIWMSEYQDKFSHGAKAAYGGKIYRPLSAPLYSPLGWRCR